MRYEIRPLGHWTDPVTHDRRPSLIFRASWQDTIDLLTYEARRLGAEMLVLQVDANETDIRRDGMLRARARVDFPGVAVSFESDHGPLRYATDAYEQRYSGDMPGWQANVRAIALALQALRAVDRYGVTKRGEQYVGWRQLPAGAASRFESADDALRWVQKQARIHAPTADFATPSGLYRFLAKRLHPDVAGDRADWDRLDQARQLLRLGGDRG